jgi:Icc protein
MPFRVVQISDTHLFADPEGELLGVRTRTGTEAVINHIRNEVGAFDLMVISGDLVHEEGAAYEQLRELLGDWLPLCRVIPGNHDKRGSLRGIFPESHSPLEEDVVFEQKLGNWQLIGLDTLRAGHVEGEIKEPQWEWLDRLLAENADHPTVIFMHHPAVQIGSGWLDQLGLLESERFQQLVKDSPQVKLVTAGHVHQESTTTIGHAASYTLPAASVQFAVGTDEFQLGTESPGFGILDLEEDGSFTIQVVRVPVP